MLASLFSTSSSVDDIGDVTRSEDSGPLCAWLSENSDVEGPALHAKSMRVANISPGARSI